MVKLRISAQANQAKEPISLRNYWLTPALRLRRLKSKTKAHTTISVLELIKSSLPLTNSLKRIRLRLSIAESANNSIISTKAHAQFTEIKLNAKSKRKLSTKLAANQMSNWSLIGMGYKDLWTMITSTHLSLAIRHKSRQLDIKKMNRPNSNLIGNIIIQWERFNNSNQIVNSRDKVRLIIKSKILLTSQLHHSLNSTRGFKILLLMPCSAKN